MLWESDPFTVKSTVNSLLSALLAIICVSVGVSASRRSPSKAVALPSLAPYPEADCLKR